MLWPESRAGLDSEPARKVRTTEQVTRVSATHHCTKTSQNPIGKSMRGDECSICVNRVSLPANASAPWAIDAWVLSAKSGGMGGSDMLERVRLTEVPRIVVGDESKADVQDMLVADQGGTRSQPVLCQPNVSQPIMPRPKQQKVPWSC